jgi:hypothetical protein
MGGFMNSSMTKRTGILAIIIMIIMGTALNATVIVVDKNGGGDYSTIVAAVDNAAAGDTVQVMPGMYFESISITKTISLFGSGINTMIYAPDGVNVNAVTFSGSCSNSMIKNFRITSPNRYGIELSGNNANTIVTNNVIEYCGLAGVEIVTTANPKIYNNVFYANESHGIHGNLSYCSYTIYSNIFVNNKGYGSAIAGNYNSLTRDYNDYFNNSSGNSNVSLGPNDKTCDPNLDSDYHPQDSCCIDAGRSGPPYYDFNGTRNDTGIYGGPNAIFGSGPVVTNLQIVPSTVVQGESFQIQATGRTK